MLLSLSQVLMVAAHCAPAAAPQTLAAIAEVESGFDSLAIGVNGPQPIRLRPASPAQASAIAGRLIAQGASVDLGLAQINSKNLQALGLTAADLFDPCRNLAASAQVLSAGLGRALAAHRPAEAALRAALSYYNTGGRRARPDQRLRRQGERRRRAHRRRFGARAQRVQTFAGLDDQRPCGLGRLWPRRRARGQLCDQPRPFRRPAMKPALTRQALVAACLAAGISLLLCEPALAQTSGGAGGNIGTFIQNVINLLNNNVIRGLAIIAIIVTGIAWMFGHLDLRRAGTVIVGIIVIFGAATIVDLITGGSSGG